MPLLREDYEADDINEEVLHMYNSIQTLLQTFGKKEDNFRIQGKLGNSYELKKDQIKVKQHGITFFINYKKDGSIFIKIQDEATGKRGDIQTGKAALDTLRDIRGNLLEETQNIITENEKSTSVKQKEITSMLSSPEIDNSIREYYNIIKEHIRINGEKDYKTGLISYQDETGNILTYDNRGKRPERIFTKTGTNEHILYFGKEYPFVQAVVKGEGQPKKGKKFTFTGGRALSKIKEIINALD